MFPYSCLPSGSVVKNLLLMGEAGDTVSTSGWKSNETMVTSSNVLPVKSHMNMKSQLRLPSGGTDLFVFLFKLMRQYAKLNRH